MSPSCLAPVWGMDIVMSVFPERERKHVGHGVDLAMFPVDFLDFRIVHDGDIHLGGALEMFQLQHGVAAAAHEQTDAGGDFDGLLFVFNDDLDLFHSS